MIDARFVAGSGHLQSRLLQSGHLKSKSRETRAISRLVGGILNYGRVDRVIFFVNCLFLSSKSIIKSTIIVFPNEIQPDW